MRTISVRIEFESLVEDGSYDAVETCRLTVPDDVSEIEVAEILKKLMKTRMYIKTGIAHIHSSITSVKNKDGYFRNFRSMWNWISSKKTRIFTKKWRK